MGETVLGRSLLNKTTTRIVDELATYDDIVERLGLPGVDRKRLQIWYHRNNYGLRDLAVRDAPWPLWHWPTAGPLLIHRVTQHR